MFEGGRSANRDAVGVPDGSAINFLTLLGPKESRRAATLTPSPTPKGAFEQQWAALIAAALSRRRRSVAAGGAPSREYAPPLRYFSQKLCESRDRPQDPTIKPSPRYWPREAPDAIRSILHCCIKCDQYPAYAGARNRPRARTHRPLLFHPEVMDMSVVWGKKFYWGDRSSSNTFSSPRSGIEPKHAVPLRTLKKISDKDAARLITDPAGLLRSKMEGF